MEVSLRDQAERLGIADRVQFLGRRPHDSLPTLFSTLDIFAMPSRWEEFGVSAVEASACGVPVVASRVGGVPEVVLDGVTGVLVPPEDPGALGAALLELADDVDRRRRLGTAGRRYVVERFEWGRCVEAMERVYRDVLEPDDRSMRGRESQGADVRMAPASLPLEGEEQAPSALVATADQVCDTSEEVDE